MDDSLMFDYLVQMGAMKPEQDELKRKQAMVDMLRGNAMQQQQGQMIGKHYVAPGLAGAISQLGQAYLAKQGQQGVDRAMSNPDFNESMDVSATNMPGLNQKQALMLKALRKKRQQAGYTPPSTESLMGDNIDAGGGYNPGF